MVSRVECEMKLSVMVVSDQRKHDEYTIPEREHKILGDTISDIT